MTNDPAAERRAAGQDGPPAAGPAGTAAELMAAVRAVERGEASAAEFFTRPAPPPAPVPAAPAPAGGGASGPAGGGAAAPAAVAEGLPELLAAAGAPAALAGPLTAALGAGAAEALRADPWALLTADGVRPEQADAFARALLGDSCGPGDERRVRALVGRLLASAARRGHTALEPAAVERELARFAVPEPAAALAAAIDSGAALLCEDPVPGAEPDEEGELPVRALVALDRYAVAEESLADALLRLRTTFRAGPDGWPEAAAAAPGPSAAELIEAVAAHGVVLHTGGEAARTEAAALLTAAAGLGLRAQAVAHTPDGCRRLAALLGPDAPAPLTVPELLAGRGPGRDAEGQLALDLLVVLDAAALGTESAAALAEAVPDGARLVFSGDPLLLGAAGPGRLPADLRAAGVCPHVVSRTPDPGPLGELVSAVGAGELPAVEAPGREVVVVPVRDAGEALHRTAQLVTESIPRAFGERAAGIAVLTPGHGGPVGTRALNAALKERLNPGPGRYDGFDPGDRVCWSAAPGRVRLGVLTGADDTGFQLEFGGGERRTVPRGAGTLRHGWALTAHQAAGRRWPAAVVLIPGDADAALDRAWVYTAFGRAERHLSVVQAAGPALARAVAADPAPRRTRLPALLARPAETA